MDVADSRFLGLWLLPILLHVPPVQRFVTTTISSFKRNSPPIETVDAGGNQAVILEPPTPSSSDSEKPEHPNAPGDTVRLRNIQFVCEIENAFDSIDLVLIPPKGEARHLFTKKISSKAWSVSGDIKLVVTAGEIRIVFQSGCCRHRGSVNIQPEEEVNRQEGEERSFPLRMEQSQTPRAQLVAYINTSYTTVAVAMGATSGGMIAQVPIDGSSERQNRYRDCAQLARMGQMNLDRFTREGNIVFVEQSIDLFTTSISLALPEDPNLPGLWTNLGTAYAYRFDHTGNMEDLHSSISHHQRAVDLTPENHPDLSKQLNNLASSRQILFQRTGNVDDLHFSIAHYQRSVSLTHEDHPDLPKQLNNLANSRLVLFEQTGNLDDLHFAIAHHQRAISLTHEDQPDLPKQLNNLANSRQALFEQTRNLDDLHLAIANNQHAVDLTPGNHPELPKYLDNVANLRLTLFGQTGNLDDLHFAIAHHTRAVDLTPENHPDLPSRLNNVANSRMTLFEQTNKLDDLLLVIAQRQHAVDLIPENHPDLVDFLFHLGRAHCDLFQSFGDASGLQTSRLVFRRAAQTPAAPHRRAPSAYLAAISSCTLADSGALCDCEIAVAAFSEAGGLDQVIHRRHTLIGKIASPISFAAAHAIICDRENLAFEWLNQGRCLVWNQIQQLRHPLDDLRTVHPRLAEDFYTASRDLETFGTRNNNSRLDATSNIKKPQQSEAAGHHELWKKYTGLLSQIRAKEGFAEFLLPPKINSLVASLPPDGPIVLFNINSLRCDALALLATSSKPILIPLPEYSEHEALRSKKQMMELLQIESRQREGDRGSRKGSLPSHSWSNILERLYRQVIEPVLKALDLVDNPPASPSERRRIWWCPTGPLSFLPLHAAGIYKSIRPVCVSDFVISSYAPSAGLLGDLYRRQQSSCNPNVLIVSQPNAPGLPQIPGVEYEAKQVRKCLSESGVPVRLLEDVAATTATVKSGLETHSWVHFASHGIQHSEDAMKSGLYMHDGRLELLDLMRERIPNTDFAFLSACQTSKGDEKLSDEVVHIAAGMLAIGYRGVVGTMWSISDHDAPKIASEFYRYLLDKKLESGGLDSSQAAFALDHSIRKYRAAHGDSEKSLLNWVPYVHFGY